MRKRGEHTGGGGGERNAAPKGGRTTCRDIKNW